MENTPITPSAIETVGAYVRALDAYQHQMQFKDQLDDRHNAGKYNAVIRLAASAELCQRTSHLDWHDEDGTFVAPGAGNVASAAVELILSHPDKERLFTEAASGEPLELDAETWARIDHIMRHTEE